MFGTILRKRVTKRRRLINQILSHLSGIRVLCRLLSLSMYFEIRAKKKKQFSLMITSLPNDVLLDILARVPRFDYPTLSLVSKHFHSLVASPELYVRRSLLGCAEVCLYAVICNLVTSEKSLCILPLKANSNNRLVRIQSLPRMFSGASFVAVGSSIYVLGGILDDQENTSGFLSIDCRSHTVQHLPSMPMDMVVDVAGSIDGKIYVIGYDETEKNFMVVFNTETQLWDPEITKLGDVELDYLSPSCIGMADKIYMRDSRNSLVYYAKKNKWETDEMLNSKNWQYACVVDEVLYYYDYYEYKLRAYDPKQKSWQVVKGVEICTPGLGQYRSCTVNYGGNLVVFLLTMNSSCTQEIWCAEIALERGQGEEICGKLKWCDAVIDGCFDIIESLAVMV